MHSKFVRSFSYFVLVISLAFVGYLMFKDLNWVLGDDDLFLKTTMIGKPIWSLAMCDYSILLLLPKAIGQIIEAHFAYNLIVMSAAIFSFYHLFNKLDDQNYGLSLFFILILFFVSGFLQIHMNCIYPERMMFLVQVLFMYFWLKGYQNDSAKFYLVSFIFCSYLIFLTEPIVAAVLVIALTNLVLGWNQLSDKGRSNLFLLSIFSFLACLRIYASKGWVGINLFSSDVDAIGTINAIFVGEPILSLIFLLAFVRAYFVFMKSDRRTLFVDSLLFGAIIHVITCMILVRTDPSWMFPALIFAFPSLVFWTNYLWEENKFGSILIVLLCCMTSCFSYDISKDFVQNTYELRNNDMKVVDFIVDANISGKYVYFFTNDEPVTRFKIGADHGNVWEFDVYTHFTNYVLKNKKHFLNQNIIRPMERLEYISDDNIVMCPSEMDQKYKDYLEDRGFKILQSALNIDIYGR